MRVYCQPPNYSHLRTFGCLCYLNLSTTMPNKLTPWSTPCIFIGYPREHKGYHCLDLQTCKVITSRHIIFYKLTLPLVQQQISASLPQSSSPTWDPAASSWDLVPVRIDPGMTHPPRASPRISPIDSAPPSPSPPYGSLPAPAHQPRHHETASSAPHPHPVPRTSSEFSISPTNSYIHLANPTNILTQSTHAPQ
jgi:hypothetical protein